MTLDQIFRPYVKGWLSPFVAVSRRIGLTPNFFTVASLIVAGAAGIAFYGRNEAIATLMVALNAFFDALDGALARSMNIQSLKGDLLDHAVDRYSDIFIITGIFAGGFTSWPIGVFALTGVLMSSYMGTQAQAVGVGRHYGGVLGRADRLFLIMVAGVLDLIVPGGFLGILYIGWLLILFGIMGHITAIQRFAYTWKKMEK
ncbi:MAG: CDP-alcohol phosphatidyltransferase family protein [Methanoregulaceae archaeon]|nr:CDP-alcohol phosphatidyltransferase family protein [Methanoregulaceae archaeon]